MQRGATASGQEVSVTLAPADVSTPLPFVFDDGAAYELMMGQWSAQVAGPFLDWLALPKGLAWLDDGCGNGSFTATLMAYQSPTTVVGIDPAPAQLTFARRRVVDDRVCFMEGDAQALPLDDACVDAAAMALVLFFLADPLKGVLEMARVVKRGGTVAAYQWDLFGGGLPLQPILDSVRAEGHMVHEPPSAWTSELQALEEIWCGAGLTAIRTHQFLVSRSFESFDEYWHTAYGSPRLRHLFATLSAGQLKRLRHRVRDRTGAAAHGPLLLTAKANAVQGVKN